MSKKKAMLTEVFITVTINEDRLNQIINDELNEAAKRIMEQIQSCLSFKENK